jgi:hypothetical protein
VSVEPVAVEPVEVESGGVDVESAGGVVAVEPELDEPEAGVPLEPSLGAVPLFDVDPLSAGAGADAGSLAEVEGVVVVPEPVSAAAGRASANAQVQRHATSTARRAADKRSQHNPTFSLPANYTSPENSPTPDVLVLRASYHLRQRSARSPPCVAQRLACSLGRKGALLRLMPLGEGEVVRATRGVRVRWW